MTMLEKLVHASAVMLLNQHYIRITIPNGTSYEMFQTADHTRWDGKRENVCKRFGRAWVKEQRSAIPIVPSISARLDRNILINPAHPDTAAITHDLPAPI